MNELVNKLAAIATGWVSPFATNRVSKAELQKYWYQMGMTDDSIVATTSCSMAFLIV